jgi:hypothetical protein
VTPLAQPPATPEALADFPVHELAAGSRLARIHRRELSPLWFRHDGGGRFDLPPPRGTLYAAAEPLGSYVEVFRHVRLVPWEEIDARRLSILVPRKAVRLADCTTRRARAFGLTGAVHTTPDYDETQAWAAAFAAAGLDGVRYLVRHDPAQRLAGFAVFAPAGSGDPRWHWDVASTGPIPSGLLRAVEEQFGLSVLPGDVL